jgi:hypothetical protein
MKPAHAPLDVHRLLSGSLKPPQEQRWRQTVPPPCNRHSDSYAAANEFPN